MYEAVELFRLVEAWSLDLKSKILAEIADTCHVSGVWFSCTIFFDTCHVSGVGFSCTFFFDKSTHKKLEASTLNAKSLPRSRLRDSNLYIFSADTSTWSSKLKSKILAEIADTWICTPMLSKCSVWGAPAPVFQPLYSLLALALVVAAPNFKIFAAVQGLTILLYKLY